MIKYKNHEINITSDGHPQRLEVSIQRKNRQVRRFVTLGASYDMAVAAACAGIDIQVFIDNYAPGLRTYPAKPAGNQRCRKGGRR